jgi:uncharacterized protein YoxC
VNDLLNIAQLIAYLSVSALCIYLIVVLVQVRDVLTALHRALNDFNLHAKPVLQNLEAITDRLRSFAATMEEQAELLRGSLESIKVAADNIVEFEEKVQRWLEEPIFRLTSAFSGVVNAVLAWFEGLRGARQ